MMQIIISVSQHHRWSEPMTSSPIVQFFNKFTMWHCCMQYPNEMNKQSFPYAQLKLMQHIHYKNSVDIEKRRCVKAFYSLNGKRKHNWKKYMTYNRWNRGGGFKQLFYSCAIDWNGQLKQCAVCTPSYGMLRAWVTRCARSQT